MPMINSNPKTS